MKRNLYQLMALSGVLLGGGVSLSASEHLRVTVPFTFRLAGLEFQPGQYTVDESNNGVVTVQGVGQAAAVLTIPAESAKSGMTSGLRFSIGDGGAYHLVGVQVEGEISRAIPAPAQERKLSVGSR